MIIKSSTTLRNDYNSISQLVHEKGEGDLVVMSIGAFHKREAILDLKEKLLFAEEQRLSRQATTSLDDIHKRLKGKING